MLLNFDDILDWSASLRNAISAELSESKFSILKSLSPEFVEDAADELFSLAEKQEVLWSVVQWIESHSVVGYHGTRLTPSECESVRKFGLRPLKADSRRTRLERALSIHDRWSEVSSQLDDAIHRHGPLKEAGLRENQVHATLSRQGLIDGFDHYLSHGSEFDQRVAYQLLGCDGMDCLANDGEPYLLHLEVQGNAALQASNRYFTVKESIDRGEMPNTVREFLTHWAFHKCYPNYRPSTQRVDCGMVFSNAIPPDQIIKFERINVPPVASMRNSG